jgi:hypothetical protein
MDPKKILGFVVVLAIGIGVAVYRGKASAAVDERIVETASQVASACEKCPSYTKNAAFFEEFEEVAHEQAYNAAYQPSGRRRSAKFDEAGYCRCFFKVLINRADMKNNRDLCTELRQAQIDAEKALAAK